MRSLDRGNESFHSYYDSIGRFFIFPMEVERVNLKEIKKVLMTGKGQITLGSHTKKRLLQRGYSKGDIVSAVFNGSIVEHQKFNKAVIAGRDKDDNPIIVVIAKENSFSFKIVTVMPPIDHQRFKDCI